MTFGLIDRLAYPCNLALDLEQVREPIAGAPQKSDELAFELLLCVDPYFHVEVAGSDILRLERQRVRFAQGADGVDGGVEPLGRHQPRDRGGAYAVFILPLQLIGRLSANRAHNLAKAGQRDLDALHFDRHFPVANQLAIALLLVRLACRCGLPCHL